MGSYGRIEELAPEKVTLASGRVARIDYEDGKPPWVESYLQDFFGMNRSVELLLSLGIEHIERHLRGLHAPVLEWAERRGVPVASPSGPHGSAIISVSPPNLSASYHALREAGIYCSLREGVIRLAPHCYNTQDELSRVTEVLDRTLT